MEHKQPSYQFAANKIQISSPLCLMSLSSNPTQRSNHQLTMLVKSKTKIRKLTNAYNAFFVKTESGL